MVPLSCRSNLAGRYHLIYKNTTVKTTIFAELHLAGQLEAALQLGEQNHIAQGGQAPREGEGGSDAAQEFSRLLQQLKQAALWIRNKYFESGFDFS